MNTYQLLSKFLTSLEARGRAEKTRKTYQERILRVLDLLPGEGGQITTERLESAIVSLRRTGMAMASLAGYVQATKTFFKWAYEREYIPSNPAKALERPRFTRTAINKAIPQGDMIKMIDYCDINELPMEKAIIMLLADTGCRVGELISIELATLDLAMLETVVIGKAGPREVDFTDPTAEALRAWIAVRPNTCPGLFAVENGPITYTRIYNALERIGKAVGAERYNPHAFRHGLGQGWIDQGANLEIVRLKLGHRDITTTAQIYGNQDRGRIKRASKRYSMIRG